MNSRMTLSILLISLVGCGATLEQLQTQAATEFSCPQGEIQRESLGEYLEKVTGCGKTGVYGYDKEQKRWRSAVERATFDLSCPQNELTVQHLGGREVGVSGCGQKAVYIATCVNKLAYARGVVCAFSGWTMNSTSK